MRCLPPPPAPCSRAYNGRSLEVAMSQLLRKLRMGASIALLGITALLALPATGQETARGEVYWNIEPLRGPVDLGLTDPALVGAIDVHAHLDPDAPGNGGQVRALDGFDAASLARS